MKATSTVANVVQASGLAISVGNLEADMLSLVMEWRDFFKTSATIDTSPGNISALAKMMSTFLNAPTRQKELALVADAAANPLYGLTLALAALPGAAKRQAQQYWNGNFAEQEADGSMPGWNIKQLPAPCAASQDGSVIKPAIKYLIVSDLHRDDAVHDDLGSFQPGSIDHFKANGALYERVLGFAYDKGYTFIEAGDCEELWFVRDVKTHPMKDGLLNIEQKLRDIIASHSNSDPKQLGVYDRLRNLHREGRYFRTYGNHDSFLKPVGGDDSVGEVLRDEMQKGGGPSFEIYDAFVIPGIKSMTENTPSDIVMDALNLVDKPLEKQNEQEEVQNEQEEEVTQGFFAKLINGFLGLDSNDYRVDTKMLVTHGHQFDFWNCPENQILGLLIANSVGMFVDRNMDPFLDARGIALQGNPWIDFGTAFAGWPVFNSWVSRKPSVRFAHDVQHMANGQRQLSDTVMFSESMALLSGTLGIGLNHEHVVKDQKGNVKKVIVVTPAMSRGETDDPADAEWRLDLSTPTGLSEYLRRHHLHHLCIGHTHNPHSQPFVTIQDLAKLAPPLGPVIGLIRSVVPNVLEQAMTVKTTYFNSGTGGWLEGVIWAIEIDETGQARLVYWTDNSIGPEYMDWELQPLDECKKKQLKQGLADALAVPVEELLSTDLKKLREMLDARLQQLAVAGADIAAALGAAVALPFYSLAAALQTSGKRIINERLRQLQEVPQSIQQRLEWLKDQFSQLQAFNYDTLLSVKRHAFIGSSEEEETLVIRAPISTSELERLERVKRVLVHMGASKDEALHYAGVAVAAFGGFPLNMPFFSTMLQPLDPMGLLEASQSPVLYGLLSTLWRYPPHGQEVDIWGVKITSTFELHDGEVSLTVKIAAAGPVTS